MHSVCSWVGFDGNSELVLWRGLKTVFKSPHGEVDGLVGLGSGTV
jgi:hypothetical protein